MTRFANSLPRFWFFFFLGKYLARLEGGISRGEGKSEVRDEGEEGELLESAGTGPDVLEGLPPNEAW